MTYASDDASVSSGKPRELYKFEGTNSNYYYTSNQESVSYGGNTYVTTPIKRGKINVGTAEDDGLDITVSMPVTVQLVRDYAFTIAPPRLYLTIYRYHDISDVVTVWKGPVTNLNVSAGTASIVCKSIMSSALSGACPSVQYQNPCNRVLFDGGCKVSRASAEISVTVANLFNSNRRIIMSSDGGKPSSYFLGGEVYFASGERRMIILHSGTTIDLNYPFSRIQIGDAITVAAGCDHAYEGDCKNKFANQVNYGGFPFIPSINPFVEGID